MHPSSEGFLSAITPKALLPSEMANCLYACFRSKVVNLGTQELPALQAARNFPSSVDPSDKRQRITGPPRTAEVQMRITPVISSRALIEVKLIRTTESHVNTVFRKIVNGPKLALCLRRLQSREPADWHPRAPETLVHLYLCEGPYQQTCFNLGAGLAQSSAEFSSQAWDLTFLLSHDLQGFLQDLQTENT